MLRTLFIMLLMSACFLGYTWTLRSVEFSSLPCLLIRLGVRIGPQDGMQIRYPGTAFLVAPDIW